MYSYNDFERLFLRYKLEGIPAGVSIEKFCMSNKVPYNLFAKWYTDTRKKIIPVQVLGAPSTEAEMKESPSPIPERKPEADTLGFYFNERNSRIVILKCNLKLRLKSERLLKPQRRAISVAESSLFRFNNRAAFSIRVRLI